MDFIGAPVGTIVYSDRHGYLQNKRVGETEFRWIKIPRNQIPEEDRIQVLDRAYRMQALRELQNLGGEMSDRDRQDVEERTSEVPTQTRRSARAATKNSRRSSADIARRKRINAKSNAEARARQLAIFARRKLVEDLRRQRQENLGDTNQESEDDENDD